MSRVEKLKLETWNTKKNTWEAVGQSREPAGATMLLQNINVFIYSVN